MIGDQLVQIVGANLGSVNRTDDATALGQQLQQ